MRLVILAAGVGERLWPLTKDMPKSIIPIGGGRTVLQTQLEAAASAKIDDVYVVVGHLHDAVRSYVESISQFTVNFVYNPFYDVSNNLHSLWMARWVMLGQDVIVINGDTIVSPEVMTALVRHEESFVMTIDRKETYDEDDMKVVVENGLVRQVGKKLSSDESNAESIGMIKFRASAASDLVSTLDEMVQNQSHRNSFWLAAVQTMIDNGGALATLECNKNDWAEIDFHVDLATVRNWIGEQSAGLTSRWLDQKE
ncbi:phosphocholine cytidylyltransferase family protein [SAR202 cluster bacterium AD-812-D07_MRT_10900m]|nr:phosphocholine cytidylyltransferase family protein [SAR202 cluster bacterium AD-812-D07_MRT_10900m]